MAGSAFLNDGFFNDEGTVFAAEIFKAAEGEISFFREVFEVRFLSDAQAKSQSFSCRAMSQSF